MGKPRFRRAPGGVNRDASDIVTEGQTAAADAVTVTVLLSVPMGATSLRAADDDQISLRLCEPRLMQLDMTLSEVLSETSTCMFETGPDLRLTQFVGPVAKVTGCDARTLVGKRLEDLAANRNDPELQRASGEIRARRSCRDVVFPLQSPTGPRFVKMSCRPHFSAGSHWRGCKGLMSDVTPYVEAERRAATTHSRLAEALESVPASVMLFDPDDRLVFCNGATKYFFPEAAHLLVPGTQFEALLRADIAGGNLWKSGMGLEQWVRDRMEHHRLADNNLTGERPDGRWVQVIERRASDGSIIGVRIDVTEAKKREAELKQKSEQLEEHSRELQRSNAELEQFAYVASHDLQEPLRMVASYCQLLQRRFKGKLGADASEFIGFAVEGATRMQQLVNDLLNYSRLGRTGGGPVVVSMADAADIALTNLKGAIRDSDARIEIGDLPVVVGDRALLVRLLQNLIGNAIKFRRDEPPVIGITARQEQDFWHFVVEDNGIGIEEPYLERVFLIFQRLHERSKYRGTGIGLAIAKKVVEHLGGRIWIESVPGAGSRFHFTLPVAAERSAQCMT